MCCRSLFKDSFYEIMASVCLGQKGVLVCGFLEEWYHNQLTVV
jgi:hypothetical protein